MVRLTAPILILSLFATGFSLPSKRDISQVKQDIADITKSVNAQDQAVYALSTPDGTLPQAIGISTAAHAFSKALQKGTTNLHTNGLFSEKDSKDVQDLAGVFVPTIFHFLSEIYYKKPVIVRLGRRANMYQDLTSMWNDVKAYGAALLADTPDDQKDPIVEVVKELNHEFEALTVAYA